MEQMNFSNIELSEELKRGISDMGYNVSTSIQSQTIPLILEGHDVIGHSQTGSGKTAAFGLPAIDMLDNDISPKTVQVLILCPTRELALQACGEMRKFSKYKDGVNIVPIYGGEPIGHQIARLRRGCQIVVGTPGRVMDHMRRRTLKLENVKMVILDEADEMLNMGFIEDIDTILTETPEDRQTVLFSATMPLQVMKITKKFQRDPKTVSIKEQHLTVSTVEQVYFNVPKGKKNEALQSLLAYYKPTASIIFCNTKKMVDELIEALEKWGFSAQGLHGDMRQVTRTQVMRRFKEKKIDILVATDVAARGIDVDDVKIVFNYDLPQDEEYYVHRIGRTGRAGRSGMAFSLVQGSKQLYQLRNIMKYTKCDIVNRALPSSAEIQNLLVDELTKTVESFMEDNKFQAYGQAVENICGSKYTPAEVASALFAMTLAKNTPEEGECFDFEEIPEHNGRSASRGRNNAFRRGGQDDKNMASVRFSIGRKDQVSPNHILGAVAGATGLPGKIFGTISIQSTFTTIDVPKKYKKLIVQTLNKTKIKGKVITAV